MNFIDRAKAEGRAEERTEARKEALVIIITALSESGIDETKIFNETKPLYGNYFSDEEIEQFIEQNTQKIK